MAMRIAMLGVGLAVLGYLYIASGYRVGTVARPGAGFFPLLAGAMALILAVSVLFERPETSGMDGGDGPREPLGGAGIFIVLMVGFTLLLDTVGFVLLGIPAMVAAMLVFGAPASRWPLILLISVITVLSIHFVFSVAFQIQLPRGVLTWIP